MKFVKKFDNGNMLIEFNRDEVCEIANSMTDYHPLDFDVKRGLTKDFPELVSLMDKLVGEQRKKAPKEKSKPRKRMSKKKRLMKSRR